MEGVRQYVISVAAAAIVVGILLELPGKKGTGSVLLRLIGGLFLTFTVIRPIVGLEVGDIRSYMEVFSQNSAVAVSRGENLASATLSSYIKSETEAYILDKADDFGASLAVEVELSEAEVPVPVSVQIQGSISPYAKKRLQEIIHTELGIMEENQIWIG